MATIGFDARSVRTVSTGMGRAAHGLLKKIAQLDNHNDYVVFQKKELAQPLVDNDRFHTVHVAYDIASLQNQFLFARILTRHGVDLYHSLNAFLPFRLPLNLKSIITIHDFNWIQRPALSAPSSWRGYANGVYGRIAHRYATSRADHIVCVSGQTRVDLSQLYTHVNQPVSTIHHGYELNFIDSEEISASIRQLQKRRYILSLGNGRPYKNPEGTIKAFARIKSNPEHKDVLLVMVGRGDRTPYLRRLVERNKLEEGVLFFGVVSDAELASLFKHALFLSFPSRWEGFGLPVIEAFAQGCPVLASTAGSLLEICDDAAVMIKDPESVEEISHAFDSLIRDQGLREKLRVRGLQQAKRFTWDSAAERYLAIYDSTLLN